MNARRIGLYSDVHANLSALQAVLADIERAGVDERVCLGDLVGYGPRPGEVIALVRSTGDPVIQGNYDRGIGGRLGDCGCYYATEQAEADGAASYAFTVAHTTEEEAAYLFSLPGVVRFEHEGARILLCHGSPRRVNEYLMPDRPDAHLVKLAKQAGVEVVCCGHVHIPYHRAIETPDGFVHYVNSGSVGKPKDGDPRACWIEVVLGDEREVRAATQDASVAPVGSADVWLGVIVHRMAYDIDATVRDMRDAGLPETLGAALRSG